MFSFTLKQTITGSTIESNGNYKNQQKNENYRKTLCLFTFKLQTMPPKNLARVIKMNRKNKTKCETSIISVNTHGEFESKSKKMQE